MASFPILLNPSPPRVSRVRRPEWIYAIAGILFVCCTSTTFMGGSHTQVLVSAVWEAAVGKWHFEDAATLNVLLRKVGHFFGHGMLSLLFCRAWMSSISQFSKIRRSWRLPSAALLAVITTFVVASLDEWHQTFTPGRVGCFSDVLIDTCGALAVNGLFLYLHLRNRRGIVRTQTGDFSMAA